MTTFISKIFMRKGDLKMATFSRSVMTLLLVALSYGIAQGQVQITVPMSGAQEVPPVASPGMGTGLLMFDPVGGTISGSVSFSGLTSATAAGHIHQAASGINGPVIIPMTGGIGVTAGTMTLPMTALTPLQLAALRNNELYINIHTMTNPGGEIRGQIIFPAGSSSSTDKVTFVQVARGDFDPARPGDELAALDGEGRIFISTDLMTWKQIPGTLVQLVSGDFDGDGMDDIAGIGEEGT
ncbi:MAG: CHRD domain-containing protein, partial [Deltaproteobacteria bacterium]